MANTTTNTKSLTIVAEFLDGDDRSISLDNPRDGITWENISNLNQYAANVLIGDRESSAFNRIRSAHITQRHTLILDPENL